MQMNMKKRVNAGNFYRECEMFFAKNLNLALATVPPMARRKVHTLFFIVCAVIYDSHCIARNFPKSMNSNLLLKCLLSESAFLVTFVRK